MRRKIIFAILPCLLLIVSCQTKKEPFEPAFLLSAGQSGILVNNKTDKNISNAEVNEKLYKVSNVTTEDTFIHFKTRKLDTNYKNEIKYGDFSMQISEGNQDVSEYFQHKILIHSFNINDISDNNFSFKIKAGNGDGFKNSNYNNFYIKEVQLQIGNEYYSPLENANEEVFLGEGNSIINERLNQHNEITYEFNYDRKCLNAKGFLLENFNQEIDLNVTYKNERFNLKSHSIPKLSINIDKNEVISESFNLEVNYPNAKQVILLLDGIVINNGFQFDKSAWANGNHTIKIIAISNNGFYQVEEIPFTLSSVLSDQRNTNIDLYIHNAVDQLPSTFNISNGIKIDNSGIELQDAIKANSPFGNYAYQSIILDSNCTVVNIKGEVPSSRIIVLEVFDYSLNKFEVISTTKSTNNTYQIAAKMNPKYLNNNQYNLRIYSCFDELVENDITNQVAWISDPQYITEKAALSIGSKTGKRVLNSMRDYLIEQYISKKISFLAITGDIVQKTDVENQWIAFDEEFMKGIVDSKLPFGASAGNHDVGGLRDLCNQICPTPVESGSDCLEPYLDYSYYTKYFGDNKYDHLSTYGKKHDIELGSYLNSRSHFDKITIGATDYLFLFLSWGSTTKGIHVAESDIAWAKRVLEKYTDERVILLTHEYMGSKGERTATGDLLFHELVEAYSNIDMVFSGHINGSSSRIDYLDSNSDGLKERRVLQMLFDYQEEENTIAASFIRHLKFAENKDQILFDTYSPYLKDSDVEFNSSILQKYAKDTEFYRYAYDFQNKGFALSIDWIN